MFGEFSILKWLMLNGRFRFGKLGLVMEGRVLLRFLDLRRSRLILRRRRGREVEKWNSRLSVVVFFWS